MLLLSDLFTGTVGEIKTETFTEINIPESTDSDYVYADGVASTDGLTYYFTYSPEKIFDVPVGALRVILDDDAINGFSSVDCAFVDEGEDAISMVEAV